MTACGAQGSAGVAGEGVTARPGATDLLAALVVEEDEALGTRELVEGEEEAVAFAAWLTSSGLRNVEDTIG